MMKIRMVKSKSASHKRKPALPQFGKKTGKRSKVTLENLRRLVAQPEPEPAPAPAPRPFVVPTILMGTNYELPSAIHNTHVNFDNYYKELDYPVPPKLGNGSLVFRPKIVKGPLLTHAIAAGAKPAAAFVPVRPWNPLAQSVGPSGGKFRGFNAGVGPFGALSPGLASSGKMPLSPSNVINFGEGTGGARRKSRRKSRKNRKSRRSRH